MVPDPLGLIDPWNLIRGKCNLVVVHVNLLFVLELLVIYEIIRNHSLCGDLSDDVIFSYLLLYLGVEFGRLGGFISEEALNIWVCSFCCYFCNSVAQPATLILVFHNDFHVVSLFSLAWVTFLLPFVDIGWNYLSSEPMLGWDMAIFCWIILQKLAIHYFYSSMGILVSYYLLSLFNCSLMLFIWSLQITKE